MVNGVQQQQQQHHSQARSSENENDKPQQQVIIKTSSLSLRRLVPFGWNRRSLQLSSKTAVSTVCSFEEAFQERQEVARTLITTNGTEALYYPQREARYLFDQGRQYASEGLVEEATESLTQALSLSDGSDLEPHILWTLVSHYSRQDEHCSEADAYLTVLKPHLDKIQDEWIQQEASLALLDVLQKHQHWSLALKLTRYVSPSNKVLARIHFEMAANLTTQMALPHLEEALVLLQSTSQDDDMDSLKQSILQSMVHAHAAEQEWDEALSVQESYMSNLETPLDMQQAHYDAAELYLAQGHYSSALSSLEQGLELGCDDEALETKMLHAKAFVLHHLGDSEQALDIYNSLLVRLKHCPFEAAKIYYTMACMCGKMGRYSQACDYFRQELKVTRAALGKYHLETSRIYHDLAQIYDAHFGNYEKALKYLLKATKVEQRALKKAGSLDKKREIALQLNETKQCMGRIHYKRGEFTKALNVSFRSDDVVLATSTT